jgi:hypothetical protein
MLLSSNLSQKAISAIGGRVVEDALTEREQRSLVWLQAK